MALTEAAPTLTTDGVSLIDVESIKPVVTAPTALVSGMLLGYVLANGIWSPDDSADFDLSLKAGLLVAPIPAYTVRSARDSFMLLPSGIVLAGAGTTVTIEYWCVTRRGDAV